MKRLPRRDISALASEIRKVIIDTVGENGGHLASNLGVVELTIALHRVFSSPDDAIIWDVSHQCYAHKLLTGRYSSFGTLRRSGGLSGFTSRSESVHDYFSCGHSSTSISSALGLLTSWNLKGRNGYVIAVIGDGALTGGMAFEALSHAGQLGRNLIVILNDNQMSIDHNTGSISRYLSRLSVTPQYQSFRYHVDRLIDRIPYFNRYIGKFIFRFKRAVKGLFLTNNLFTDLGFEYAGPFDGHNEAVLEQVLGKVRRIRRPVVVHVVTKKGKGYSPAENHPEIFHGVGPFCTSDGTVEKYDTFSFTEAFSRKIVSMAEENPSVVAVTAAMAKGTGLSAFSRRFPDRFFDVGIAEEHAVTFAGGLAAGGLFPVICIYSTFMQRAVDQVVHDIALQKAPCLMVLDRAGPVPNDGATHQGIFDIALFRPVPGICILSVAGESDLSLCLDWALRAGKPVIVRYPKHSCPTEIPEFSQPVVPGRGILVPCGECVVGDVTDSAIESADRRILVVTTGGMYPEVQKAVRADMISGGAADIYILRFIKPFDMDYFLSLSEGYYGIVFVEDGVRTGGISVEIESAVRASGKLNTEILSFGDRFYPQGSRGDICAAAGMSPADIADAVARRRIYG